MDGMGVGLGDGGGVGLEQNQNVRIVLDSPKGSMMCIPFCVFAYSCNVDRDSSPWQNTVPVEFHVFPDFHRYYVVLG
jgi:hypothetical protein